MGIKFTLIVLLSLYPLSAGAGQPPLDIPPDGWSTLFQHEGIVVQERSIPGRPIKAYRSKGILKASIDQILEVLSDTAAQEWMPDLDQQQVITAISDVELITLMVYGVPFPFNHVARFNGVLKSSAQKSPDTVLGIGN